MEILSNIITYLIPGIIYVFGFIVAVKDPHANIALKLVVLAILLIHIYAFCYPTNTMACLVIISQAFLLLGSYKQMKIEKKSKINFHQFYLLGSIAILISHLIA